RTPRTGTERRNAWNPAEAVLSLKIRVGPCEILLDHGWISALVTVDRANLPATCNLADHTVIQVSLSRPERKLIQIAQHKSVGNVLVAEALFTLQVIGILRAEVVRLKTGQDRKCRIGIREGLGKCVRRQEVQAIAEATLNFRF